MSDGLEGDALWASFIAAVSARNPAEQAAENARNLRWAREADALWAGHARGASAPALTTPLGVLQLSANAQRLLAGAGTTQTIVPSPPGAPVVTGIPPFVSQPIRGDVDLVVDPVRMWPLVRPPGWPPL